ncbi:hypothetical protein [Chloroflexus aurantiacus]
MIIHLFPNTPLTPSTIGSRRRRHCRLAPTSLHVYRRALIYRLGIADGRRPAVVFNTIAQALLSTRV